MKKRLDDLFDEASAKELDTLMENKTFSAPLDDAVLARIEKQTLEKSGLAAPKAKKRIVKRALLLAATFAVLLAVTLGAVACAAEQKEYREALKFFEEHDLSTEGLTRGEIKKVYRDITLRRFTYSKTAEVIEKSVWTQRLEGVEILQNDPTPEEIEEIWERLLDGGKEYIPGYSVKADGDVSYNNRSEYGENEYGNKVTTADYIECYDGDLLRWSLYLEDRQCYRMYPLNDGLIADCYYVQKEDAPKRKNEECLLRISDQGEILWEVEFDDRLYSSGCFDNDDGTVSVLMQGTLNKKRYLDLKVYDAKGEVLESYRNEITSSFSRVSRISKGYVLIGTGNTICITDFTGKVTDSLGYASKEQSYHINDVIEYGGKIYLSLDAVPKHDGYELKLVHDYAYKQWNKQWNKVDFSYTDKKLLQLMRDYYTATLMVCDPNDGVPKVFYSQKGAFAGKFSIDDAGALVWDVASIVSVEYTPYLSSSSFNGRCYVYQYAFDTDGKLLGQKQTERIESYWK